ncbi:MAG: hypothetical protein ACRELG_15205 [Gemmataceae bacterium]
MKDAASARLLAALHSLERKEKTFRDLSTEALALAARPSRPLDQERIQRAEDAFDRGETKPFFRRYIAEKRDPLYLTISTFQTL